VTWKARLIEPGELEATIDLTALAFAVGPRATNDYRKQAGLVTEPDRVFVVEDGDVLAGTAASFTMAVALPGGQTLPLAGVTEVGVSPVYRRRGILRTLMEAVHEQARDRDEPVAGLTASEGGIYRRFGYGVATRYQSLTIDRPSATEIAPLAARRGEPAAADAAGGRIRVMSDAEARPVLPAVWERYWRQMPGEVRRPDVWWEMLALDVEEDRDVRLEGGPDGATCRRSDAEPDLAVGVADLGALLLGGVSWSTLWRAGLVDERRSGAVTRADGMFRPDRAPYCSTDF
jgi:predicted acetyltransferase